MNRRRRRDDGADRWRGDDPDNFDGGDGLPDEDDLDPEGPSRDDLARFGGDTIPCPHCGREVHAEAAACPRCEQWIDDPPEAEAAAGFAGRGRLLLVGILVAMLLGLGWCVGGRVL
jgi:hypothetical protein